MELQSRFMRWQPFVLAILMTFGLQEAARAQQTPSAPKAPAKTAPKSEKKAPASAPSTDSNTTPTADAAQTAAPDPDAELQLAVQQANNDNAALVRNLEAFLVKYPE